MLPSRVPDARIIAFNYEMLVWEDLFYDFMNHMRDGYRMDLWLLLRIRLPFSLPFTFHLLNEYSLLLSTVIYRVLQFTVG